MTRPGTPRILHVSGDFPDPLAPEKTPVFERLLDLTSGRFDHRVVSINRTAPQLLGLPRVLRSHSVAIDADASFEWGRAIQYRAPAKGLLHWSVLSRLGKWIAYQSQAEDRPDLIVAHKLTIEGIAVAEAARHLAVPYALILQGNTDGKILRARPDLRARFRKIYEGADAVFALAPWTAGLVDELLGPRKDGPVVLPCPVGRGFPVVEPKPGRDAFVSAFNLRDYRNKNFAAVAQALGLLKEQQITTALRVAGGGPPRSWRIAQSLAKPYAGIELLGTQTPSQLSALMNDSIALVLPSRRESFGLVFIEALRSGCPIIYPMGAAIAGYFDNCSFAIPVDVRSPQKIAEAMRHTLSQQDTIKADLTAWQSNGGLDRFSNERIAADFAKGLQDALDQ